MAPSPLDDSDNPKWEECEPTGKAEPVRGDPTLENVAAFQRHWRNISMPNGSEFQVTVTETLAETGERSKQAEDLARFLDDCKVTYEFGSIEIPDEQLPAETEPLDEAEVEKEFTLAFLSDPPHSVIVHIDPPIGKDKAHIYHLVAPSTRASARVRATKGKVRMGIMKGDEFVSPLTTNEQGGGPSPTVYASWHRPTTFKVRVRGLRRHNRYRISTCWERYP
jgi:hypothetical protein